MNSKIQRKKRHTRTHTRSALVLDCSDGRFSARYQIKRYLRCTNEEFQGAFFSTVTTKSKPTNVLLLQEIRCSWNLTVHKTALQARSIQKSQLIGKIVSNAMCFPNNLPSWAPPNLLGLQSSTIFAPSSVGIQKAAEFLLSWGQLSPVFTCESLRSSLSWGRHPYVPIRRGGVTFHEQETLHFAPVPL